MAAEVEEDDALLPGGLRLQSLVNCAANRVGAFRSRDDALRAREQGRRFEARVLRIRLRLDVALGMQVAEHRRHRMVPQAASVDARRHERVTKRVHLHQRRHARGVAEVVAVFALRQAGAGGRLDREEARVASARDLVGEEGEDEARGVRTTAGAADDDIRVLPGHLHLLDRFLSDDRLVDEDVVEDAAERILGVLAHGGVFDRFGDGDAEGAVAVRIRREDAPSGVRVHRRAGDDRAAPELHHRAAIRLLVVGDLDHVHLRLDAEHLAGEGERRAPLPRARLRGDALHTLLGVVVGLGDGRVRLVRTRGRYALVLEVDVGGRIEGLLQGGGADERRRAPELVGFAHLVRDGDVALGRDFLLNQLHREERRQRFRADRLVRAGVQRRRRRRLQVRGDVVPLLGYLRFIEVELLRCHCVFPFLPGTRYSVLGTQKNPSPAKGRGVTRGATFVPRFPGALITTAPKGREGSGRDNGALSARNYSALRT